MADKRFFVYTELPAFPLLTCSGGPMSWLFGVSGRDISEASVSRSRAIHGKAFDTFANNGNFYFAVGGLPATCFSGRTLNAEGTVNGFWISLGCGFGKENGDKKLYGYRDWSDLKIEDIGALDGHFVHLRYEKEVLKIFTDTIGLRTLYWAESHGQFVFSTRLDWVAKYLGGRRIDFERIGSRWLLYNQLTYDSPVSGIQKLGPSGRLVLDHGSMTSHHTAFTPDFSPRNTIEQYSDLVSKSLHPRMDSDLTLSLGLSGGLDSRTLLSMLLQSDRNKFQAHTFGDKQEPDVFIASRISKGEKVRHIVCDIPLPGAAETIPILDEYVAQTNLAEPAYSVIRLRHYNGLDSGKYFVVDGAFGEVSRRQYMNRLLLGGVQAVTQRRFDRFVKTLAFRRGNIFNADAAMMMKRGAEKEIGATLETMPDPRRIGIGNYLDLWVLRTRVPNYGCDEQARVDGIILNYMPFVQPSLANCIFGIPVRRRNGSNIFKTIISLHAPQLERYPLVKNNATFPYHLSRAAAMILAQIKLRMGLAYEDASPHLFLEMMKEFVFDALHSKEAVEYDAYDHAGISKMVHDYYSGVRANANEVCWWLTFELWRRRIERP